MATMAGGTGSRQTPRPCRRDAGATGGWPL